VVATDGTEDGRIAVDVRLSGAEYSRFLSRFSESQEGA
jgi:hypothetical protein